MFSLSSLVVAAFVTLIVALPPLTEGRSKTKSEETSLSASSSWPASATKTSSYSSSRTQSQAVSMSLSRSLSFSWEFTMSRSVSSSSTSSSSLSDTSSPSHSPSREITATVASSSNTATPSRSPSSDRSSSNSASVSNSGSRSGSQSTSTSRSSSFSESEARTETTSMSETSTNSRSTTNSTSPSISVSVEATRSLSATISISPSPSDSCLNSMSASTSLSTSPSVTTSPSLTTSNSATARSPTASLTAEPTAEISRSISFSNEVSLSSSVTDSSQGSGSSSTSLTLSDSLSIKSPSLSATRSASKSPNSRSVTGSPEDSHSSSVSSSPTAMARSQSRSASNTGTYSWAMLQRLSLSITVSEEYTLTQTRSLLPKANLSEWFSSVVAYVVPGASSLDGALNATVQENPVLLPDFVVNDFLNIAAVSYDSAHDYVLAFRFCLRPLMVHRYFNAVPDVNVSASGPGDWRYRRLRAMACVEVLTTTNPYNRFNENAFLFFFGPSGPAVIPDAMVFRLRILSVEMPVPSYVNDLSMALTSIGSLGTFSATAGAMQGRAALLLSLTQCSYSDARTSFSILGVGSGDQDRGFQYRGAVVGNLAVFAIATAVPIAVSIVVTFAARPKVRVTTWRRCLEILHLPSVAMVPASLIIPQTAAASVALFVVEGSRSDIATACVGMFACLFYSSLVWYNIGMCRPLLRLERRLRRTVSDSTVREAPNPNDDPDDGTQWEVDNGIGLLMFRGEDHWVADNVRWDLWKKRNLFYFKDYRLLRFAAMELWISILIGMVNGLVIGSESVCYVQLGFTGLYSLAAVGTSFVLRPELSQVRFLVGVVCNALSLGIAIMIFLAVLLKDSHSTTLYFGSGIFSIVMFGVLISEMVARFAYAARDIPTWLRNIRDASDYRPPKEKRRKVVSSVGAAPPVLEVESTAIVDPNWTVLIGTEEPTITPEDDPDRDFMSALSRRKSIFASMWANDVPSSLARGIEPAAPSEEMKTDVVWSFVSLQSAIDALEPPTHTQPVVVQTPPQPPVLTTFTQVNYETDDDNRSEFSSSDDNSGAGGSCVSPAVPAAVAIVTKKRAQGLSEQDILTELL